MKQYWQIAKNTWDETLTYRTSFVLYRVREVFQLVSLYFIWLFVTPEQGSFLGYTQSMMLTYVLLTALVGDLIFATRTTTIANDINQGLLVNFLIKPLSFLKYYFARDLGDKAMNITFSVLELSILLLLLQPTLFWQTNISILILFFLSIGMGILLHFFISVLLGFIGFWSNEGWGPRFIFYQMIAFFSGGLFPLDMLPKPIYSVFQFLPFTYLNFFPIKVYFGELSAFELVKGFLICGLWIGVLYYLVQVVWRKGLKSYTAQGQ